MEHALTPSTTEVLSGSSRRPLSLTMATKPSTKNIIWSHLQWKSNGLADSTVASGATVVRLQLQAVDCKSHLAESKLLPRKQPSLLMRMKMAKLLHLQLTVTKSRWVSKCNVTMLTLQITQILLASASCQTPRIWSSGNQWKPNHPRPISNTTRSTPKTCSSTSKCMSKKTHI